MPVIPVHKDGKLVGFFEPAKAEFLGEAGFSDFEWEEYEAATWTECYRLPNGQFVFVERGIASGFEATEPAQVITKERLVRLLVENHVLPPADLLSESGVVDFTANQTECPNLAGKEQSLGVGGSTRPKRAKQGTIHQRMLEIMHDKPDSIHWSAQDWADHLKCAKSTVWETSAWNTIQENRERVRVEAEDQRRKQMTEPDD